MKYKLSIIDFQQMINQLAEVWPDIKKTERSKRCYNAICDLEKDFAQGIINHFLDNYSKMPLPSDFVEASKVFKKHYFEKTGSYYGSKLNNKQKQIYVPECSYCYDSGFEWIEIEQNSVFCFCFCKEGDQKKENTNWLFPKMSDLSQVKRKTFPLNAFMPKEKTSPWVDNEFKSMVQRFIAALKESQDFWSNHFKNN